MKRGILFVLAALVLAVPAAQAEYQHIDLTVFGMD